ncbi:MAG: exodeoxyribonuclease VII large subunit [Chloroherpetonaceae bacterium]|nr:exodeoxyribonuclease VII large subunit [Chloroherpetonaceae bacterium]
MIPRARIDEYTACPLSVTELTLLIKENLETKFPSVHLRGEISNFKQHASGHLYFTLKDASSQISAVMWRSLAMQLNFEMKDGLEVIVQGSVQVYEPHGRYQVVCTTVKPVGEGYLQQEFRRLFERLKAEGLFNEERKKPLPRFPECIGIITSPTGAVIEDMKTILGRRYRAARLLLYPARVQGEEAVGELIAGIRYFNRSLLRPDVLILARGGGSLEDLWAFNSEELAYAIAQSEIPIISAVGHETDYTIADFVADRRASTPSMAAEIVAPAAEEILQHLEQSLSAAKTMLRNAILQRRQSITAILDGYAFNRPLRDLDTLRQRLDFAEDRLHRCVTEQLAAYRSALSSAVKQLHAMSPSHILARGYAIVLKDGTPVRSAAELQAGDRLTIQFSDGEKSVYVLPLHPASASMSASSSESALSSFAK